MKQILFILFTFYISTAFAGDCGVNAITSSQKQVLCAQEEAYEIAKAVELEFGDFIFNLPNDRALHEEHHLIQKSWINITGRICSAEAKLYKGGTLHDWLEANCLSQLYEHRLMYLQKLNSKAVLLKEK